MLARPRRAPSEFDVGSDVERLLGLPAVAGENFRSWMFSAGSDSIVIHQSSLLILFIADFFRSILSVDSSIRTNVLF
jgi:hypothetical protein